MKLSDIEDIGYHGTDRGEVIDSGWFSDKIYADGGDDRVYARGGNDKVYGGEGNDYIDGGWGDDEVYGDIGDDTLVGGYGDDIIVGGEGNDYLVGGEGRDTYIFKAGDGQDTIDNWDWSGEDTIKLGEGISKEDVIFFMKGNDLIIKYGDNDEITVKNQKYDNWGIETIQIEGGYFLNKGDINRIIQEISTYAETNGINITNVNDIRNNQQLMNIIVNAWHT